MLGYTAYLDQSVASHTSESEEDFGVTTCMLDLRYAERLAVVLLAGPLAEGLLLGRFLATHGSENDLRRFWHLCLQVVRIRLGFASERGFAWPKETPEQYAKRLCRKVRGMLAHPDTWRAVTVLADDLAGWGRLDGNDAADTIQWSRQSSSQMLLPMPVPGCNQVVS